MPCFVLFRLVLLSLTLTSSSNAAETASLDLANKAAETANATTKAATAAETPGKTIPVPNKPCGIDDETKQEALYITIVACILTAFFFASPIEAGLKMHKDKDAGGFSAIPVIMSCTCSFSQIYFCLVNLLRFNAPSSVWLNFSVNLFGFVVNEGLLFFHYAYNKNRGRVIMQHMVAMGSLLGVIAFLELVLKGKTFDTFPPFIHCNGVGYVQVTSIVCILINIGMYAGPLAVLGTVIQTKSVEFLPLGTSVLICFQTAAWAGEGLFLGQITFWGPNVIGFLLGVFQVGLYFYIKSVADKKDAREVMLHVDSPA